MEGFVAFPVVEGDDGSTSDDTSGTQLPDNPCHAVVLQADPGNGDNIKFGLSSSPTLVLTPGDSISLTVENLNLITIQAASGTQTVNWTYLVR